MIRFEPGDEPLDFDLNVRQPGLGWLKTHPGSVRPAAFWSTCRGQLARAFNDLCAYGAMYEPVGTVDHFVSCREDLSQSYEWLNYRYSSQWINASKSSMFSRDLLDPFEVEDSWFRLLLPSLQLVVDRSHIPPHLLEKAESVLKRLHLRDDERILRQRREWYRMYQEKELTLEGLRRKAPLIARAVERQIIENGST